MSRRLAVCTDLIRPITYSPWLTRTEPSACLAATGELFDGYHSQMRAVHRRNGDQLAQITTELAGRPAGRASG